MRPGRNITLWDYIGSMEHFSMASRKGERTSRRERGRYIIIIK